jgi:hypothetical protein
MVTFDLGAPGAFGMTQGQTLGAGLMAAGAASSAIGAYYATRAQEYQAASTISRLEWEQTQSYRRAKYSELAAREAGKAGQERAGLVGLEYAQVIATSEARGGASGTQAGVGSRKEISASMEWSKDTALETVTKETADVVANMRMQRGAHQAQAALIGGQAAGVRELKGALSPGTAMFASLMGSAASASGAYLLSGSGGNGGGNNGTTTSGVSGLTSKKGKRYRSPTTSST